MNEPILRTLVDVAGFLNRHKSPFSVIGGIAVAVRGEPRFTADVDIVIGLDVDQSLGLLAALPDSPFRPLFPGVEEVVRTALLLPIRHEETGIKVDLAIGLTGFERQVIARSTPVDFGQCTVPVATSDPREWQGAGS